MLKKRKGVSVIQGRDVRIINDRLGFILFFFFSFYFWFYFTFLYFGLRKKVTQVIKHNRGMTPVTYVTVT